MSSDYKKIREENIKKYGTEINVFGPTLLANLYSDPTHFIYELLQNAEDAGATEVKFRLYKDCIDKDRLELEHNGQAFNEADVRGICGLVAGTKKGDLTKIGKFGIGFKSVYAHTQSPEIHSEDEHFAIDNYVQPYSICPRSSVLGTLFVFPFNHEEKDPDESFDEISKRLKELGASTLLFLKHIESIEYEIDKEVTGTYLRQTDPVKETDFVSDITVIGQRNLHDEEERWLVFEKDVTHLAGSIPEGKRLTVEIAFQYSGDAQGTPKFECLSQSNLVASFPTEKETHLGFLIQGPYRTTPARDNIPQSNTFNIALAKQTGDLVVEALRWLRDRNWLTVDVLTMMPLAYMETRYGYSQERNKYRNTLFEPVYKKVLEAIKDEDLIPAYGGGYVSGGKAKLARGQALCELLDDTRLGQFFHTDKQIRWISSEVTQVRTPNLRSYLDILGIEEINAEKFARRIGEDFLECQSDDWVREFYEFASEFSHSYSSSSPFSILKGKPIIRLEDGRHVVPFQYGEPQAYLPTEHESQFDTIKREVCNSGKSLIFLRNLGLKEPDIVDEVRKQILPKYAQGNEIDGEKHKQDIAVIVKALNEVPRDKEYELIQDLKRIPFLLATNAEDVKEFRCPVEIYRRTPELEMYFEGNPEVWFLSSEYASYADDFEEMGVASQVRVSCKSPDYGHVVIEDRHGWHVRGLYGFDPGCSFDGLKFALSQPNIPRSKYIWEHLIPPYKHSIEGAVESCPRQTFIESEVERKYSIMGELVREMAWLPNKQGEFVVPKEITLDELPDDFSKDKLLAIKLGMKPSNQAYLDNVQQRLKKMDQYEAFEREHPGELDEFMRRRIAVARPDNEPYDGSDHLANMYDAFNHNDKSRPVREPRTPLKNPDHRPEQTEEELKEFFGPTNERPDLNLAISEVKDPKTRNFLRREYDGHCQISSCNYTFRKQDGTPYFDAVYIASNKGGRRFDNPGNALCLCPNHRAEFLYGTIETPDIFDQIKSYSDDPYHNIEIQLCGEYEGIRYTANHINRLKEIVEAAEKL